MPCMSAFFERSIEVAENCVQAINPTCRDGITGSSRGFRAPWPFASFLDEEANRQGWGPGRGTTRV